MGYPTLSVGGKFRQPKKLKTQRKGQISTMKAKRKEKTFNKKSNVFFSLMALNRMWLNDLIGPARRWRQIQFRIDDYVSKSIELESINVS